jgi:hypothetical protein
LAWLQAMSPASTKEMERLLLEAESIVEEARIGVVNRELGQIIERLLQILTTEKIRADARRDLRGAKRKKTAA